MLPGLFTDPVEESVIDESKPSLDRRRSQDRSIGLVTEKIDPHSRLSLCLDVRS